MHTTTVEQPILKRCHFFLNSRPPFKKIKYWTTNTRMVKAWKGMLQHEFQHSCIVEFSTRPRFDSDGEPPLSLIRIVDCMVGPYCRSRPPRGNMAAVSHCSCPSCWIWNTNETQDVSRIVWNTNNFKVIVGNYCGLSGPPGEAAQLEKWLLRQVPW